MTSATLSIQNLTYSRGKRTLIQDINFEICPGTITVLIGPNGSGKSTIIKTCLNIWEPEKGEVLYGKENLTSFSPKERAKIVSYVPQQTSLKFPLRVHEVVAQGRYTHLHSLFFSSNKDEEVVCQSLEAVGSLALKDRLFPQLSGGEQQRILLARALATQSEILFLDEPTSSLDIRYIVEMNLLFKKIAQQGKTLVLALHDLNYARQLATEVVLLKNGAVFAKGSPEKVLSDKNIKEVYQVQEEKNQASAFSLIQ